MNSNSQTTDEATLWGESHESLVTRILNLRAKCDRLEREAAQRSGPDEQVAADAARWHWLLDNATRMSEPLEDRRPGSRAITGHRVSLIVSFKGDYRSAPWATQEMFTEYVDMERLSATSCEPSSGK